MTDRPPASRKSRRPPPVDLDPLIGRTIARKFEIESLLGAGAMGAVYRARQIALDKKVAIKVLHRQLATDPTFAQRFQQEAKAASRLDHPNSIRVFDFGEDESGLLYIAMEYVEGKDLFTIVDAYGPLPPASIIDILVQALGALAVAHDMGVLHRDLKPENIMIVRGKGDDGNPHDVVKVCDFGIAKVMETREAPASARPSGRKLTGSGLVIGTPEYMSPEQARGLELDPRSDLYSIGVILYQLLTASVPFEAATALGVVLKQIGEPPRPPSSVATGVDPDLEAICMKALAKDPAGRYQDAREMRLAVRSLALQGPSPASFGAMLAAPINREAIGHAKTLEIGVRESSDAAHATRAGVAPVVPGSRVSPAKRAPRATRSRAWLAVVPVALLTGAVGLREYGRAHDVSPLAATVLPLESVSVARVREPVATSLPAQEMAQEVAQDKPGLAEVASSEPVHADAPHAPRKARNGEQGVARSMASGTNALSTPPAPASSPPVATVAPPPVDTVLALAPPSPAPLPPPAFDVQRARAQLGTVSNTFGTTPSNVNRALSPTEAKLTACYRAALPAMTPPLVGSFTLHVETGDDGTITDGRLSGANAGLARCVVHAAVGRKIPNVDTGSASADVALVLSPR